MSGSPSLNRVSSFSPPKVPPRPGVSDTKIESKEQPGSKVEGKPSSSTEAPGLRPPPPSVQHSSSYTSSSTPPVQHRESDLSSIPDLGRESLGRVTGERRPDAKKLLGPRLSKAKKAPASSFVGIALPNGSRVEVDPNLAGKYGPLKKHLIELGVPSGEADTMAKQISGSVSSGALQTGKTWTPSGIQQSRPSLRGDDSIQTSPTPPRRGSVGLSSPPKKSPQSPGTSSPNVTLTLPGGREVVVDRRVAQDPALLGDLLLSAKLPREVKQKDLRESILESLRTGGSLDFSGGLSKASSSSGLHSVPLVSHSGEVFKPPSGVQRGNVTWQTRTGSSSTSVYTPETLPPPIYGVGWSKALGDIVPKKVPSEIQIKAVGMDVCPTCNNGGAKPYVVEWPDKKGMTLMIDASHAQDKFAKGNGESFELELKIGSTTLQLPGLGTAPLKLESPGRAQIAIQIPKAELDKQFINLSDTHNISVQPFFNKVDHARHHWNDPHLVRLAPMFDRVAEARRYEWPEVPVNREAALTGVRSPFLGPDPKIKTSMETEAEFTLKVGTPEKGERAIEGMVKAMQSLVTPKGKDIPEGERAAYHRHMMETLGLPPELFDSKSTWKIESKNADYEFLDAKGGRSEEAKKKNPVYVERFKDAVAPLRPGLQELGIGRPGMVKDTYLHVGDDGIVRQRGNFREDGTMITKGANRRAEEGSPFMVRYCRQLSCPQETPIMGGKLGKPEDLKELIYHPEVGFQDALFKMPPRGVDPSTVRGSTPELKPEMEVDSERFRYLLVRGSLDEHGKKNGPDVMIELSFDISTGYKLGEDGKRTLDPPVRSYGFEFGLDHLGASGDKAPTSPGSTPPRPESSSSRGSSRPSSSLRSSGPSSSTSIETPPRPGSGGPKEAEAPVVPRELHDRLDLTRPDLFDRPAYNVFTQAVRAFTPALTKKASEASGDGGGGLQIRIGGEKAATMKSQMLSGHEPEGYKPATEILK